VQAVKDFNFCKDDVVVVILPDSIRSYLTKVGHHSDLFVVDLFYCYHCCLSLF
jgi:cystathionine beta-synthase